MSHRWTRCSLQFKRKRNASMLMVCIIPDMSFTFLYYYNYYHNTIVPHCLPMWNTEIGYIGWLRSKNAYQRRLVLKKKRIQNESRARWFQSWAPTPPDSLFVWSSPPLSCPPSSAVPPPTSAPLALLLIFSPLPVPPSLPLPLEDAITQRVMIGFNCWHQLN